MRPLFFQYSLWRLRGKGLEERQVEDPTRIGDTQELKPNAVEEFRQIIYQYYTEHRREMPWRVSRDPYNILVSEIMLQQTQVGRVLTKYEQFISTFPDFNAVSKAPLQEILGVWQGLGYNRRAIALQKICQLVVTEYGGVLPSSAETLQTFPGIGPATAGAICAFAFNQPTVFIETNIRRVFIHFFFPNKNGVKDKEILPLVEGTLDTCSPRRWYHALMDYGAMLKNEEHNPNRRSAHYNRQAPFQGSNREIRGLILKTLLEKSDLTEVELIRSVGKSRQRVQPIITQLTKEGFLVRKGDLIRISA
jgi:A/G-specific adenine glycosylase